VTVALSSEDITGVIVSPDTSAAGGGGPGIRPDGRIAMKVPITSTAAAAAVTVESTKRERRRR